MKKNYDYEKCRYYRSLQNRPKWNCRLKFFENMIIFDELVKLHDDSWGIPKYKFGL